MTLQDRLKITVEIAREAGEMILEARRSQTLVHHYKQHQELVTDTDLAVDTRIAERLSTYFADEPRLSEELSPDHALMDQQGPLWVVDPIDGTVNFAHGRHHVAVSIAWVLDGRTRVGVVHAPFLEETFTGLLAQGAWCNETPIQASHSSELSRSLVATGFPYHKASRRPLIRRLAAVLDHCQDVRRNGAAALDLCDVACGRVDAYYESVSPWDCAAGWLIAREAGARTGHLHPCPAGIPEDLWGRDLLVSAPGIHEALRELINNADAGILESR